MTFRDRLNRHVESNIRGQTSLQSLVAQMSFHDFIVVATVIQWFGSDVASPRNERANESLGGASKIPLRSRSALREAFGLQANCCVRLALRTLPGNDSDVDVSSARYPILPREGQRRVVDGD